MQNAISIIDHSSQSKKSDSDNLLDFYKPLDLSQVIGDRSNAITIEQYLKQYMRKKPDPEKIIYANLLITGSNGIGKTSLANLVLAKCGFERIIPDLSGISITRKSKRKKKADDLTHKEANLGANKSVQTFYSSLINGRGLTLVGDLGEKKKIALIFDDVSNISNQKDKDAIKSLIKLNNKLKKFPIIVIANTKHSKTVNEIRKMITYSIKGVTETGKKRSTKIQNELHMKAPSHMDFYKFAEKICKEQNLNLIKRRVKVSDVDIFNELILHAQNDVRRLLIIMQELKDVYGSADIKLPDLERYILTSKRKDIDPGIFEAAKLLLNSYTNINEALHLYSEERTSIPLMVHENYPGNIAKQYPLMSNEDQIDLLFEISKSISESDRVDGLIYSKQCWNLQQVHGFYSCVQPSYLINKTPDKKTNFEVYSYTKDFNKSSIKKINNKVIKKAQEHPFFKKVSIYDFLYIASILKTLLERKDFETLVELMKPYNLTLKEIESIIKIDKINKTKNILTGKQNNILKEMLASK